MGPDIPVRFRVVKAAYYKSKFLYNRERNESPIERLVDRENLLS